MSTYNQASGVAAAPPAPHSKGQLGAWRTRSGPMGPRGQGPGRRGWRSAERGLLLALGFAGLGGILAVGAVGWLWRDSEP